MAQIINLEELKRIYTQPSWGYSDAELAERLGTTRSAIYKIRRKWEDKGIVFEQTDRGRYRIDRKQFLANISLKTEESTFLLIQALKSVRQNTLSKKHSRNALEKLASAMYQPMAEQLVKAATKLPLTPNAEKRDKIFEVLVQAWTEQSKVRIWYTGKEPVEVWLKFHRNVAQHVQETQWHRNENIIEQPDGSVIWSVQIAEPREMLPWVRGWGADCEVLAPAYLREELAKEVRSMLELYNPHN